MKKKKKIKKEEFILHLKTIFGVLIQLIRTRFLLRVIDIFSKYAWVVPLNDEKGKTIVNAFQKQTFR